MRHTFVLHYVLIDMKHLQKLSVKRDLTIFWPKHKQAHLRLSFDVSVPF